MMERWNVGIPVCWKDGMMAGGIVERWKNGMLENIPRRNMLWNAVTERSMIFQAPVFFDPVN